MAAKVISVRDVGEPAAVRACARVLMGGGVAVFPTDTVYGVAAHPAWSSAVDRIYAVKGRPPGKPLPLLAADMDAVDAAGAVWGERARRVAARYWPGPLTLVLKTGSADEGFRVPALALARDILRACGGVLRATSANLSGRDEARTADRAVAQLGERVDLVLDGGPCATGGAPSTVARVTADSIEILRAGAVSESDLWEAAVGGR